ncbi:hypothetical protein CGCS363_v005412 [Colletotrichum siamense]|uniref:uncharacterized protein n=1 Tax=Colletotrichum siamense TaxID=690259 RepID=UPI001872502E|nr:uncharacterized protein CGCS363_v005412 [Colletotrichum siamense]KAF5505156.1 hypothetical protein CGCS363_v005412 [Colletotrichum siamense]
MTTPSPDDLLSQLLAQPSIASARTLSKTSPPLSQAFKDNLLTILKHHIAPSAWPIALSCVDRRLLSKKHRAAFDADFAADAVADPRNAAHWDLHDLCALVGIIDGLLFHIGDVGHGENPGVYYDSIADWEDGWRDGRSFRWRGQPERHPLGERRGLERDQGGEDPENFRWAFQRLAGLREGPLLFEGVDVDVDEDGEALDTRPRLQRAFFRLEFLRRAYYARPLFPRGARWQTREATFVNGAPTGVAGETYATRLARAEVVFRGWTKSDFAEVICAFKATLNHYAVEVDAMLRDFGDALEREHIPCADVYWTTKVNNAWKKGIEEDAAAVGLQYERNVFWDDEEREKVLFGEEVDDEFYEMRQRLWDERLMQEDHERRMLLPLSHAEFDDMGCTIFRSSVVQRAWYPYGVRYEDKPILPEAAPDEEMARYFHVLCSLPLKFLDQFIKMDREEKRRFLKTMYHAISRMKASHTPLFFSGEVRAWSSKPADASDARHWDYTREPRLFPELAVRCVTLSCLFKTYEMSCDPWYHGWRLWQDTNLQNQNSWKWDKWALTPFAWKRFREQELRYDFFDINPVLRTKGESWAVLWRSPRRYLRLIWTGPEADRPRWEGYLHPGRLDPNECYCHVGEGCAMCTPLPLPKDLQLEWELFTPEEMEAELEFERKLREPAEMYDELLKKYATEDWNA